MPILDLQRRMRQLGEIRIGHVVPTKNGKTRPEKLNKFRFTSPSQAILADVAAAYGGEVRPWSPANGGPDEFEVYTHSNRIPVVVPPLAVTQWYELYKGSKCVRRCDGKTEQKSDRDCFCDPERRDCSITTRLNVMLRDVPPIGHWLLTSRGYYAAIELPGIADLLAKGGGNVPGWLSLEERRIVTDEFDKDGRPIVNRFIVPTLDIELSPAQVLAGNTDAASAAVEGGQPERKAIEAAPANGNGDDLADYMAAVAEAEDAEALMAVFEQAKAAGVLGGKVPKTHPLYVAIAQRHQALTTDEGAGDEPDPDVVWRQILERAGQLGMTETQLNEEFAAANQGVVASAASAGELAAFLRTLQERAA